MKVLVIALLASSVARSALAQTERDVCRPAADTARAAIRLEASARVETLRLDAPTSAVAAVRPCNAPGAVHTRRENLPEPAQPGVTYRNVAVRVRITAEPAIVCRLAAALAADSARSGEAACVPPRP
jgi:hypothetical protein